MEFNESGLIKREYEGDVKPAVEVGRRRWMTLHCGQCNTVLADSSCVCGEAARLELVVCLRVTDDVIVTDAKKLGRSGDLVNCVYSRLRCGVCSRAVGKVIHAAPLHLSTLRSLFLLAKASISCYVLNSGQTVNASTVSFDQTAFRENLEQTKRAFEAALRRSSRLKSSIVDGKASSRKQKK